MSANWKTFLDGLKNDSIGLLKNELTDFIQTTKQDHTAFIREQGEKLDRYLGQLAMNQITKDEFAMLVKDLRDLAEAEALKLDVADRARTQRLVKGVTDLIVNRLLGTLP